MPLPEIPLDIHREGLAETTLELVSFDTANPPGETREIVEFLATEFAGFGLNTERVASDEAKPNLLATVPGRSPVTLLFSGHLDTVPCDAEGWSYDPLGERDGDRIYGRGATDMKGAVAAMIELARANAERDRRPPVTLAFAFVSDEEVAGEAGVRTLVAEDRLDAAGCVIGEPTCTETAHSVTVADRGSIWLTLDAVGEAAHGSRPMLGENAIDRLWAAVETVRSRLASYPLAVPESFEPILQESVDYYAASMDESEARRLFERPTVNLGRIEGGEAVNSVPRRASAELDIRLTAGIDTEDVLAEIEDWVGEFEGVSVAGADWSVGTYEPPESPLVAATTAAASDVLGEGLYRRSATGGGDAKQLRDAGIPTVEFAAATDTAHACDEYTTVDALAANAEVYARLAEAFAGRKTGE